MPNEIIVTARAGSVDAGNSTNPTGAGQNATAVQLGRNWDNNKTILDSSSKNTIGDEIKVIGKKMKDSVSGLYVNSGVAGNGFFKVDCIGSVSAKEIFSILSNMKFTANDHDYGVGRGGANQVGQGGSQVPIDINIDALRGYNALQGGDQYLVLHELAHALVAMQNYNAALWDAYRNGAGKGLSPDQQRAQYPNSDEFKQNEARANSVARSLRPNGSNWNFTPTNDYQQC